MAQTLTILMKGVKFFIQISILDLQLLYTTYVTILKYSYGLLER